MGQPDAERQRQARQYAALRRRVFVAELVLGGVYLLAIIGSGLAITMRDVLSARLAPQVLLVASTFVLLCAAYGLFSAPLAYYSGFRLPHRFGLSKQSFRAWLGDVAKGALVSLVLGLVAVEVVYLLLSVFPGIWWLLATLAMLLLTVVLSNLAPIILVPLFYHLTPLADKRLADRLTRLARRASTRVNGVYVMNMSSKTTAANAALMGLGNTRRIVLGDTMLANYDEDEIETILAHELAHHVHADIPKGIALQSILTLVAFYLADQVLTWSVGFFEYTGVGDVAAMPLLGLALGAFGAVTIPVANAYSRHIEGRADRYALASTGKPEPFARAMVKLADQNLAEYSPPRWVELLFYDHPPAARRLAVSREYCSKDARGDAAQLDQDDGLH